jgi:hypothetical protein
MELFLALLNLLMTLGHSLLLQMLTLAWMRENTNLWMKEICMAHAVRAVITAPSSSKRRNIDEMKERRLIRTRFLASSSSASAAFDSLSCH